MSIAEKIHRHVEQYVAAHPQCRGQVQRRGSGLYTIDGRNVEVGFCREGFLVVHDGPLRQPLSDYIEKKETNVIYHQSGLKNSALNVVPKETRISFGDEDNRYSRLDAMKVAKQQAIFREKAANYVSEGQYVPSNLTEQYQKIIDAKLGNKQERRTSAPVSAAPLQMTTGPAPAAPAWWAGVTGTVPASSSVAVRPGPPAACSHTPPMLSAPSATHQARSASHNLFGQVPDLLQIVAARGQPTMATAVPLQSGTVTTAMPTMGYGAIAKAPSMVARPVVAGRLCGA